MVTARWNCPKTGALLRYLAGRPATLMTKKELYAAVCGDVVASDDTLTVTLRELRRALRDDPSAARHQDRSPPGVAWPGRREPAVGN